jgi:hypothetical protein
MRAAGQRSRAAWISGVVSSTSPICWVTITSTLPGAAEAFMPDTMPPS